MVLIKIIQETVETDRDKRGRETEMHDRKRRGKEINQVRGRDVGKVEVRKKRRERR